MPALFDRVGIRFQYPENWQLDESEVRSGRSSVSVESPSGAIWAVSRQDRTVEPQALAESALAAMLEEYSDIETEPIEERLGPWQVVGYDLHFFYLDFVTEAKIRAVRTDRASYLVHAQAETRDFAELAAVFEAMTVSLLGSEAGEECCEHGHEDEHDHGDEE